MFRKRFRQRVAAPLVAVVTAGFILATAPTGNAAQQAAQQAAGPAAAPPGAGGARMYLGNSDDGGDSGQVDVLAYAGQLDDFPSPVDEDDGMAVGDLPGAGEDVVIADDGTHHIHVFAGGSPLYDFDSHFDSEEDGLAVGNIFGDLNDEILVADEATSWVYVYRTDEACRSPLSTVGCVRTFSATGFDSDDRLITGDVDGNGLDEFIIVNSEDEGRVDAFDENKVLVQRFHTGFDGNSDRVAAGYVGDDRKVEIVVANDEGDDRNIEIHDQTAETRTIRSGYDSSDKLGVGDVTGDLHDDIVLANDEDGGRIDVIDVTGSASTSVRSNYDSDDRFAVGSSGTGDLDNDGIPDRIELTGIPDRDDGTGGLELELKGRASPCRKDVLVEIDYMVRAPDGSVAGHSHEPPAVDVLDKVTNVLRNPAVKGVANCPYPDVASSDGLNLIITNRGSMDRIDEIDPLPLPDGFADLKKKHFDADLDPFVHYVVWAHFISGAGVRPKTQGRAYPADDPQDFVVSMGDSEDADALALTFVHELGHVLGLRHGGDSDVNCKPNYLSVMNYAFPTGVLTDVPDGKLGFSGAKLDPLYEKKDTPEGSPGLSEPKGINGPAGFRTRWTNGKGVVVTGPADGPLDWTGDGGTDEEGVSVDVNTDKTNPICDGGGDDQVLTGFDDWAKLDRDLEVDDEDTPTVEITAGQRFDAERAQDQAQFPDTAVALMPPCPGFHGTTLGVAADAGQVYAVHQYRTVSQPSTSDQPGTLAVHDRASMTVKARLPVGLGPRSVAVNAVTHRAYVVNGGPDYSVTVIDTAALTVVATIALKQVPFDVVVNPRLNRIYVSNPYEGLIHVIDGATNLELAPVPIGPGVRGLALDEATGTLYGAMTRRGGGQPSITALGTVIDDGVNRPTVLPRVDLGDPGIQPEDVAYDPVRRRVYVAGLGTTTVSPSVIVLDRATRRVLKRVAVPGPVRAVGVSAHTGLIVAVGDRGVDLIGTQSLTVERHIGGGVPFAVATGADAGRQFYVGDDRDGTLRRYSFSGGDPQ